jgi:Terminase large subunit gpA, endonuclease domain
MPRVRGVASAQVGKNGPGKRESRVRQVRRAIGQHEWNRGEEFQRWRFDRPKHESTQGFRLNGLNSPWLDWRINLVGEYREAKRIAEMGDESLLRVFFNTRLARSYRVLGKQLELDLYHDRREVYPVTSPERRSPMASCF